MDARETITMYLTTALQLRFLVEAARERAQMTTAALHLLATVTTAKFCSCC